jgi:hypothetical protein
MSKCNFLLECAHRRHWLQPEFLFHIDGRGGETRPRARSRLREEAVLGGRGGEDCARREGALGVRHRGGEVRPVGHEDLMMRVLVRKKRDAEDLVLVRKKGRGGAGVRSEKVVRRLCCCGLRRREGRRVFVRAWRILGKCACGPRFMGGLQNLSLLREGEIGVRQNML